MPDLTTGGRGRADDGAADPGVAAALAAYADGRGSERAALTALAAGRLLVPVVAVLAGADGSESAGRAAPASGAVRPGTRGPGERDGRAEKASEMALPTLVGEDGRTAVLAFTCLEAMRRWRPDARPVPVPAPAVWQAGAVEASAVVVDVAGPAPLAVDGARLAALAEGKPPPAPPHDPDVRAAARDAIGREPAISGYSLASGDDTDLALRMTLADGCDAARGQQAAARVAERLMAAVGGRLRRGIEVDVAVGAPPGRP